MYKLLKRISMILAIILLLAEFSPLTVLYQIPISYASLIEPGVVYNGAFGAEDDSEPLVETNVSAASTPLGEIDESIEASAPSDSTNESLEDSSEALDGVDGFTEDSSEPYMDASEFPSETNMPTGDDSNPLQEDTDNNPIILTDTSSIDRASVNPDTGTENNSMPANTGQLEDNNISTSDTIQTNTNEVPDIHTSPDAPQNLLSIETEQTCNLQYQDIGITTPAGCIFVTEDTYTLKGSGTGIGGTSDDFFFAYEQVSEDFIITTKVVSIDNTDLEAQAQAGIMVRETTSPSSKCISLILTPENKLCFDSRKIDGASIENVNMVSGATCNYLRLIRKGNSYSAYLSDDGAVWTRFGDVCSVDMNEDVMTGLCVSSHSDGSLCTAIFENFVITTLSDLTDEVAPTPVEGLMLESATETQVHIKWNAATDNGGVYNYEIYRNMEKIGDTTLNEYVDSSLLPSTEYIYTVRACDYSGNLSEESSINVRTMDLPMFLTVSSVTDNAIVVSWEASEDSSGYEIEVDGVVIDNELETSYVHTGLLPGTSHTYRVKAKESLVWSELLTVYTQLNAPANLQAAPSTTFVSLFWDAVQGATGYDIEADGVLVENILDNGYVHIGLAPGSSHTYRVRARLNEELGLWSEAISEKTLQHTSTGGTIAEDTVWTAAGGPYLLTGSLTIPEGVTLTVEPGAIIKSDSSSRSYGDKICVEGKMNALGTAENPIVFTAVNDPEYGGKGVITASQYWNGIEVGATGELIGDYVKVRYGGRFYAYNEDKSLIVKGKLTLTNSELSHSFGNGIYVSSNIQPIIAYNSIHDNSSYGLYNASTTPIDARYNYWGSVNGPSVYIENPITKSGYWTQGGNKVSPNVICSPWIGYDFMQKRSYGKYRVAPSGNYSNIFTDMVVSSPGFATTITRAYNSGDDRQNTMFGRGWTFGYESSIKDSEYQHIIDGVITIKSDPELKIVRLPDGSVQTFNVNGDGTFTANDSRSTLTKNSEDKYVLTLKNQEAYYFNKAGYLEKAMDQNDNTIEISVDADGKVHGITDTVGRQYTISYNSNDLVDSITDVTGGRTITYEYDSNRLIKVTDAAGKETNYGYDTHGSLTEIRDSYNKLIESVSYIYDENENKYKVHTRTDSTGNAKTYTYDNSNYKVTITDSKARETVQTYDHSLYITSTTDAEGKITKTVYGSNSIEYKCGEERSVTDRNGNTTTLDRDANGNIIKITNPDNSCRIMTYDDKNNLTSEKDEEGKYTFYDYGTDKKNLLKVIKPLNGTDQYTGVDGDNFAITYYTYYLNGLVHTVTDSEGSATEYTYNQYGNLLSTSDPETGELTVNEYDARSILIAQTSPKGYRTEITVDNNGNVERTVLDGGETTRTVYDKNGRKTKEISPNQYEEIHDGLPSHIYSGNHGTRYTYYDNGNIRTVTDAQGSTTTYTYDISGNVSSETKPNGSIYRYEYDLMNRPSRVYFKADQNSGEKLLEEYTYDILTNKNTQKTHTVHLNGSETATTVYTYDYAGRQILQANPDGTSISSSYNKNGTLKSTKDARGNTTYYKYDGLNQLTEQWSPVEANKYSYSSITYDKAGRQKQIKMGKELVTLYNVPVTFAYTSYDYYKNGRVKSVTDGEGRRTDYFYDYDGVLTKEVKYTDSVNSNVTEYVNNHLGKPVEMKVNVKAGDIAGNNSESDSNVALTTIYTYDKNGNLKTVKTPNGITTEYSYDNLNRQTGTSTPGKDEYGADTLITTSTTYDWQGKVLTSVDPMGNTTANEYDQRGNRIKVIDAMQGTTGCYYDNAGRLIAEVSPENYNPAKKLSEMNRVEYVYDKMGRLKAKLDIYKDPASQQWVSITSKAYKYDSNGNTIKELDALGYEAATNKSSIDSAINTGYGVEYAFNYANQVITTIDPETKLKNRPYTVRYTYDGLGRKTTETNAAGVITSYSYDDAGNVLSVGVKKTSSAAEIRVRSAEYDFLGNAISQTDGNGNTTSFEYNALGKLRKAEYPEDSTIAGNTVTYWYDVMGNLIEQRDSMGRVDVFEYDGFGRELSHTQKASNESEIITTYCKYDKNGNIRFETNGNENTTEYTYDALNRLISTTVNVNGTEQTTTMGYDKNSNKTSQTDWRGNSVTNIYDPLNRLIEVKDQYNKTIQRMEYNHSNAQVRSYDALNNLTHYEYDRNNRQVAVIDPSGSRSSQTYDNMGNIGSKIDGRNNRTSYTYDEFNRLATVTNAKNETTSYTYDSNGNMLTQTDARGNTATYEYNVMNLPARRIDHGGRTGAEGSYTYNPAKTEVYTYNPDGSLKTKIDRNGKTTNYTYDIHGRLTKQTCGTSVISYTYDNNGNQTTMTDSTGTTTRTYDELNRVLTKSVPDVGITVFEYDIIEGVEAGCWAETSADPKGNTTSKVYDRVGRLKSVAADGKTTTYTYYDNGSTQSVVYHDGSREDYTYYPNGRLWTLKNKKADGTILDEYVYEYDAAGNQTKKTDSKGITRYTYDMLNRLETVTEPDGTVTSYTFDRSGNRATEIVVKANDRRVNTYTYNEQNRLTTVTTKLNGVSTTTTEYVYDNNGNQLTTAVNGTTTATNTYDELNQLISTLTNGTTVNMRYNGEGYRVEKSVSGAVTKYLYEYDKVVLELDGSGNQTGRNVYGTNLLMRTADGTTYYYMYNGHADVTALLTTDGTIAGTYYYDAFGNITEQTGDVNNSITYAGYQYDEETGLYYLNARMYDPKIARFLQEDTYRGQQNDPLSLNLYTYCANEPIKYWDPTGHLYFDGKEWVSSLSSSLDEKAKELSIFEKAWEWVTDREEYVDPANFGQAFSKSFKHRLIYSKIDMVNMIIDKPIETYVSLVITYDEARYDPMNMILRDYQNQFAKFYAGMFWGGKNKGVYVGELCGTLGADGVEAGISHGIGKIVSKIKVPKLKGTSKTVFTNTQNSAQTVAKQFNGKVTELKNGYKVEIPNPAGGNKPVVARIMNEGSGGRSQPYFRVSIDGKGSYTLDGLMSSDRALTHIDMSNSYMDQITNILNSIGR